MPIETKTTITCDGCGKPIEVSPGYPHNYYLRLGVVDLGCEPARGGGIFAVAMGEPLDKTAVFHSLNCLSLWNGKPKDTPNE